MKNSDANVKQQQFQTIILTLDQHQAAELLAVGKTDEEVSRIVGVKTETICQWRQKPEFVIALDMLRVAVWGQSNNFKVIKETPHLLAEKAEPTTTLVDVSRF